MYQTKTLLSFIVGILISFSLFGQTPSDYKCGLQEVAEDAINDMDNQGMKNTKKSIKKYERKQKRPNLVPSWIPFIPSFIKCNPNRTIPVVFHVIHRCGVEKVNPSQITEALQDANKDFNAMNEDRLLPGEPFYEDQASIGLNFVLAEKDPFGNSTSGINYIEQIPGLSTKDIQRMTHWPRDKYLNVWVIPRLSGASGYAFYPYLVDDPEEAYKDGIVIVHEYLGTTGTADSSANGYHGRRHILTHEIGHWLGLEHAWGDYIEDGVPRYQRVGSSDNCQYDDKVCDTPNTKGDSRIVYSRPIFEGEDYIENNTDLPHTCASGECGGDFDNIFNFMDYGCEVMFTKGQKQRMENTLCAKIAQRLWIGTPNSNLSALLGEINLRRPRIQTNEYFFFESYENDGSIENCIDIEIRGGRAAFFRRQRSGLLIPNVDFQVVNANGYQVQIQVNESDSRRATICLTGKSTTHENKNNIENMSILFKGESIRGQDVFNRKLSGFKIVYKDNYVIGYDNYISDDYRKDAKVIDYRHFEQDAFFSDVIGELGIVADVEREDDDGDALERFLLYTASSYDVKVLCDANTKDITMLYEGDVITNIVGAGEYTYKTVTTGLGNQAVSFNPNDWAGKSGYIGISATSGCNGLTYYAWVRVEMAEDGQKFYVYDMGYPTGPNLPVKINTKSSCDSLRSERIDISGIERITIDDFVSQSGHDGGYRDFTHKTINLEAGEKYDLRFRQTGSGNTLTEWYIWVDFNNNGCFSDPNELIFNSHLEAGGDIKKEFALSNHKLLKNNVPIGTYIMRIACNPRSIENPCGVWRAGEREDYKIIIDNDNCQQPLDIGAVNVDFIDNSTVELLAPPIEDNEKIKYYFFYWGKKGENIETWEKIRTSEPTIVLDDLEVNTVYGFYLKVRYKSSYCGFSTTSPDSQVRFFKTSNQAYFSGNSTNIK